MCENNDKRCAEKFRTKIALIPHKNMPEVEGNSYNFAPEQHKPYIMMMKRIGTFFAALAMIAGSLWGQTPADSISDGLDQKQDSLVKRLEEVVVEQ